MIVAEPEAARRERAAMHVRYATKYPRIDQGLPAAEAA
jgi:hypothetical protein